MTHELKEVVWLRMRVSKLEHMLSELSKFLGYAVWNVCFQPSPLGGDGFYCAACCVFLAPKILHVVIPP